MSLANRMALASERVHAVAVEANEFPRMSAEFGVQGVPRTVVNRSGAFVGALPEPQFVDSVLRLAGVDLDAQQPPEPQQPRAQAAPPTGSADSAP